MEITAEKKTPKMTEVKIGTKSNQANKDRSFVAKCTWKRTDVNENNFSFKKINSGTV